MSYGYGGRSNPYDQRGPPSNDGYNPPQQYQNTSYGGGYDSQPYGAGQAYGAAPAPYGSNARYNVDQPAMGRDNYGSNVEMEPLAPNGSSFGRQVNPNAILNECKEIDKGIGLIRNNMAEIEYLQRKSLGSMQSSENADLDKLSSETIQSYRMLTGRVRAIKQHPDSGSPRNASQVGRVDRDLKAAIQDYIKLDTKFQQDLKAQMTRQYKIVKPDASDTEVEKLLSSDPSEQRIFTQALMQSDRRGASRVALSEVEGRHAEIQKISSQMQELGILFEQMNELVVQQEESVTLIEQKGEEVVDNIQGGNEHLVKGVELAKARNRKKWWCLLICVLILVVIGVVVAIYFLVIRPHNNPSKRSIPDALQTRDVLAESLPWIPRGRSILGSTPLVPAFE